MLYLLTASILWSLSFGLIGHFLHGVDSNAIAFIRLTISLSIFLPFLKLRKNETVPVMRLILLGAVQYGIMYLAYIRSYQYLESYQVAVFTIFTPIFVTLIYDAMQQRFHRPHLLAALLAVVGSAIIVWPDRAVGGTLRGILLIQLANLCFAFGQVGYKTLRATSRSGSVSEDASLFAYLYLGAVIVAGTFSGFTTDWHNFTLTQSQIYTLLYLGILPSGIAFFLWNVGAKRVNSGILAAFNNAKIPLAVLASLLLFQEKADWLALILGGSAIIVSILFAAWKPNLE
jgi:carboxylate/amino acid/amine transporter